MNNRDARTRVCDGLLQVEQDKHEKELAGLKRKWEFRYNNQDKRLKELEATIKNLRKKNRALREELKDE